LSFTKTTMVVFKGRCVPWSYC